MPQAPPRTKPKTTTGSRGLSQVVNVATVPNRSPFRYPGGKTWLVPLIRSWLLKKGRQAEFIEPFAGGGIVSLSVAAEGLAEHVTMVELDEQVAAVWRTILSEEGAWLAERILTFELTPRSLAEVLQRPTTTLRELAFQTLLKNRTYHGGILARGAAPLRQGENGKGIHSRWYAATLHKRILEIGSYKERISFVQGDGLSVIQEAASRRDALFFLDPPYSAGGKRAGRRLYTHHSLDHPQLFRLAQSIRGDFLMTYDDSEEIRALAKQSGFCIRPVPMKTTHHRTMAELLIGRDLDWNGPGTG